MERLFIYPSSALIGIKLSYKRMNCFIRRIERYSEKHTGKYRINLLSICSMRKEMIPQTWLDNKPTIQFEDTEYPTVGEAHVYLTNLYGDYMTLSPENERTTKRHKDTFAHND